MCGFHQSGERPDELSVAQVRVVAEHLAALGARHLVITGGEPFLRPDLPDVIAAFAARRFSVRIQTNGGPQVSRALLEACVRSGLQDLSVSVDTLDRSLQDELCGARGVLDHALATLRLAGELLPGSLSLANVVASARNFEELPKIVDHFCAMGTYAYITPVMIAERGGRDAEEYRFRGDARGFDLKQVAPGVRDRVMRQLIQMRRDGCGVVNSTRFLLDFWRYLESGACEWRCDRRGLSIEVHPDGGVSFCKEKTPWGNILDPDFLARYRRGEFHRHHAPLVDACVGCFYGEYREPYYTIHDLSVLREWTSDWFRTFRRGMRFRARTAPGRAPASMRPARVWGDPKPGGN
jgi:MoaA/NifB/PqqE/SkfB family radical SAM enzyme